MKSLQFSHRVLKFLFWGFFFSPLSCQIRLVRQTFALLVLILLRHSSLVSAASCFTRRPSLSVSFWRLSSDDRKQFVTDGAERGRRADGGE